MPQQDEQIYRSYLLRYWLDTPENDVEEPIWRFALECVADAAERHEFSSLEALNVFISAKLAAAAGAGRAGRNEVNGRENR